MSHQKILILDFGSQVTQLIARRVREAHVFCEVHPCDVSSDWVREYAKDGHLKGIILSGSHASVYEVDDKAPEAVYELGLPVLGMALWIGGATLVLGLVARAKIGGQTGDILGAAQQLAEVLALTVAAALLGA